MTEFHVQHILLDIEGTTCPVTFVSDVLFPYARREVAGFLQRNNCDDTVLRLVEELQQAWLQDGDPQARALHAQGPGSASDQDQPATDQQDRGLTAQATRHILSYIDHLIQQDRKLTAWKDLQGYIWQEGYARGDLRATLFPEVANSLRGWHARGLKLSVYSSGSVEAQKLLYAHSQEGDLCSLFSHWFDTRIGAKQQPQSYEAICRELGCRGPEVLFVSDALAELEAARSVGLQTAFSARPGNPQQNPGEHVWIRNLDELRVNRTGSSEPLASGS